MTTHSHKSITILTLAVLGFSLFQFSQVLIDRSNLRSTQTQIEKRHDEINKAEADNQKLMDQLNAIAVGTARLADAGNANAKEIVTQLAKAGIKINPNFKEEQEKAAAAAAAKGAAEPAPTKDAPKAPEAPKP